MKSLLTAAIGAGLLLAGSTLGANALPAAPAPDTSPLVQHVAQGCGPGFFRGPYGGCRPMGGRGYGRPGFGPRPLYGPRRFYGRPGPRFYRY